MTASLNKFHKGLENGKEEHPRMQKFRNDEQQICQYVQNDSTFILLKGNPLFSISPKVLCSFALTK